MKGNKSSSNVGSVVEFSPATREARVRFPDVAVLLLFDKGHLDSKLIRQVG